RPQVLAEVPGEQVDAPVQLGREHRLVPVQAARHVDVLSALPGEQEGYRYLRGGGRGAVGEAWAAQGRDGLTGLTADHGPGGLEGVTPAGQRERNVVEVGVGVA